MKAWLMQLFLVVILSMTANANWQFGSNAQFIYNNDCDFNDPTFPTYSIQNSSPENCGQICSDDADCKYFVARDNQCFLKGGPATAYNGGATCGVVFERI